MWKVLAAVAAAFVITASGTGVGQAQAPKKTEGGQEAKMHAEHKADVIKFDPAFDALVAPDAKIQSVAKGFGFTEGPNWVQHGKEGYLLFSDIPNNVINKMTPDGKVSVYLDRSGYTGPFNGFTILTAGGSHGDGTEFVQLGTDGTTLDKEGRIILCNFGNRALERIEKDGKRTVLADKFEGKRLNGPNDAVVKRDGSIYFSDTFSGLRDKRANGPQTGIPFMAIFMIKDGKLTQVVKDQARTNGLAFSPDEKYLYTNEGQKLWRYDVQPDGTLSNKKLFIDESLSKDQGEGGSDGMRVDAKGNVWTGGPGGIWAISPEGKHLGTIDIEAANLTFGDADWKTVYFAAREGGISKIRTLVSGIPCHSCN